MKAVTVSRKGKREVNADYRCIDRRKGIYILADGVGNEKGAEASRLAVQSVHAQLKRLRAVLYQGLEEESIPEMIQGSVENVNRGILWPIAQGPGPLSGLATTLDAAFVYNDGLYTAHVGDSRIYHYDGTLRRVTQDHVDEQGALTHWMGAREPSIDIDCTRLLPGAVFLLATDGITKTVHEEQLSRLLAREPQAWAQNIRDIVRRPDAMAEALVSSGEQFAGRHWHDPATLAKKMSEHDNYSFIAVRWNHRR